VNTGDDIIYGTGRNRRVLVLLIGEVLDDPRVYKTCMSLHEMGADVTVACTNPGSKPQCESHRGLSIVRFPHRGDSFLKKIYFLIRGRFTLGVDYTPAHGRAGSDKPSFADKVINAVLDLNFRNFLKSTLSINRMMVDAFSGERFDLVHANDVDTLVAGSMLRASGAAGALLYDAHEYWAGMGAESRRSNRVLREIEGESIRSADYVVTVNPLIADLLEEQYSLKQKPSVVMNCPYRYGGPTDTDTVHKPVRVIFQGKMQAYRGLENLVRAVGLWPHFELTISGYGPLERSLRLIARKTGADRLITFSGRYAGIQAIHILLEHDIGIIPYEDVVLNNRYASPNKLFEYAMAGLAVVASDLLFMAGVVRDHGMGEVLLGTDPQSIASTLEKLCSSTERITGYKKNARSAGVKFFSWEKQFEGNYPWRS